MAIAFRKTADEDELVEAFQTIMVSFGEEAEERDIERARKTMPTDRHAMFRTPPPPFCPEVF